MMYAKTIENKLHYFGEDYEFTLTDEKFHNYRTLVVAPKNIKMISNRGELSKSEIVELWFGKENETTRENNNKKRREK